MNFDKKEFLELEFIELKEVGRTCQINKVGVAASRKTLPAKLTSFEVKIQENTIYLIRDKYIDIFDYEMVNDIFF